MFGGWSITVGAPSDGASAIFTNETKSYYRQHEKNTLGIGEISRESYSFILKIKLDHYKQKTPQIAGFFIFRVDYSD